MRVSARMARRRSVSHPETDDPGFDDPTGRPSPRADRRSGISTRSSPRSPRWSRAMPTWLECARRLRREHDHDRRPRRDGDGRSGVDRSRSQWRAASHSSSRDGIRAPRQASIGSAPTVRLQSTECISIAGGHRATRVVLTRWCAIRWWLGAESNHRHADFQSAALPTELPSQGARLYAGRRSTGKPTRVAARCAAMTPATTPCDDPL